MDPGPAALAEKFYGDFQRESQLLKDDIDHERAGVSSGHQDVSIDQYLTRLAILQKKSKMLPSTLAIMTRESTSAASKSCRKRWKRSAISSSRRESLLLSQEESYKGDGASPGDRLGPYHRRGQ